MSVFNEEEYLEEMLDSLLAQTYTDWRLIVRNNGSTDATEEILKSFKYKFPNKILLIDGTKNILPVYQSFSEALNFSESEYVMFADGDDVWLKDKISKSLEHLISIEENYSKKTPILVFTDLNITDKSLNIISTSMWNYQSLNPENTSLNRMIIHNVACGNTFIFNKALSDKIYPIPEDGIMHDRWTALIATSFGKISYIKNSTMLYRQHGENTCGSETISSQLLKYLGDIPLIKKRINDRSLLAKAFLKQFGKDLNENQKIILYDVANLSKFGFVQKRIKLFKRSLYMNSIIRNLGLFLLA